MFGPWSGGVLDLVKVRLCARLYLYTLIRTLTRGCGGLVVVLVVWTIVRLHTVARRRRAAEWKNSRKGAHLVLQGWLRLLGRQSKDHLLLSV